MKNRKNTSFKLFEDKHCNNIEFLETKSNNKKFSSMNNFNIYSKMDKLEEEFALENKNSKNLVKKIFHQLKLINEHAQKSLYKSSYTNRESRTENNKEKISQLININSSNAILLFNSDNSLNLKKLIIKNIEKLKFKINECKNNELIEKTDMETILKSDEKYLITNEHIINNCASLNYKNANTKNKKTENTQETMDNLYNGNNISKIKDLDVIEEKRKLRNLRNSKNREDYKKFLIEDNIKLRKSISAVLNNQEDLHKYLDNKFCPIISQNFEKEKSRLNKMQILSAKSNKRSKISISQNSTRNKNDLEKQKFYHSQKNIEDEIKNIKEKNMLEPRKYNTANNFNKKNDKSENKIIKEDNTELQSNFKKEKNFISNIKRIKRPESQDMNSLFLTNMGKKTTKKPLEESEINYHRPIFTPDDNWKNNNNRNEIFCHFKFPARNILKIKNEETDISKKNKSCNLKESDIYYKNKKKIQILQHFKENKIPLKNKNISRNSLLNILGSKHELSSQETGREILCNEELNSFFKEKNEQTNNKKIIEYSNVENEKEEKENSILNVIFSKTNSNKKLIQNPNNKDEINNIVNEEKIDKEITNLEDNTKILQESSPKKSEKKEYIYDPIEKELNFSRSSTENKEDELKNNAAEIGYYNNLFKYKTNFSSHDKNDALKLKENLNSNIQIKEKLYEKAEKYANYNYRQFVLNKSGNKILPNKSASNFFSKNKIFSYSKDDRLRNADLNLGKDYTKFTGSLKVKKVKFNFDENFKKAKMSDILKNKHIDKTLIVMKTKK